MPGVTAAGTTRSGSSGSSLVARAASWRSKARRCGSVSRSSSTRVTRRARRARSSLSRPSRTFSRPGCGCSSAGSTRAASPRLRRRTSPIRATTSGGSCTPPDSRHACSSLPSSSSFLRTASASRTPRRAPRRARGICARRTSTGAADRLAGIASELRPAWIGFVGKEAYRGAFGERPELGVQERKLGDTQLFVLPSTSPANAAVPWDERLRWFRQLAAASSRASGS